MNIMTGLMLAEEEAGWLAQIWEGISNLPGIIWYGITDGIGSVLFWIVRMGVWVVNICETFARKLVGLDTYYYNGQLIDANTNSGTTITNDILEVLVRSDVVRNLFLSLLALAIVLLIIVTFVSVWKTEWNFEKDGNSKSKVINAAFKALFNLIAVPVIAFFGIIVGNALLRAIDGVTSGNAERNMGTLIMTSLMTEDCVRVSTGDVRSQALIDANLGTFEYNGETVQGFMELFVKSGTGEIDSQAILNAFNSGQTIKWNIIQNYRFNKPDAKWAFNGYIDNVNNKIDKCVQTQTDFVFTFYPGTGGSSTDPLLKLMFDSWGINYFVGYIIMYFMISSMLKITFAIVKRLFYTVILFVVCPPIIALAPLNPKPFEEWKKIFISYLCCAYVTIAIYNIFLTIYPLFEGISLIGGTGFERFFEKMLFIAVGLITINDLSGEIAKALGVGELYSSSVDKNGKSLWSGAFKTAGSGFKPITDIGKATGKAIQYGNIQKYAGANAMWKQMGEDAKGAILGDGGLLGKGSLLGNAREGSGIDKALSPYRQTQQFRNKNMVDDTEAAYKDARNNAESSFVTEYNRYAKATGKAQIDPEDKHAYEIAQKEFEESNPWAKKEKYDEAAKIVNEISKIDNSSRTDEQKKQLSDARKAMKENSVDETELLRAQIANNALSDAKALNNSSAAALIRNKNGATENPQAIEAAQEALTKQSARLDAKQHAQMDKSLSEHERAVQTAIKDSNNKALKQQMNDLKKIRKEAVEKEDIKRLETMLEQIKSALKK
ncbi:MAG: hypothetical protein ACI4T1_04575 [Christensenellales bacterium]